MLHLNTTSAESIELKICMKEVYMWALDRAIRVSNVPYTTRNFIGTLKIPSSPRLFKVRFKFLIRSWIPFYSYGGKYNTNYSFFGNKMFTALKEESTIRKVLRTKSPKYQQVKYISFCLLMPLCDPIALKR